MDWEEYEKDELLVRYLDRELSSSQIERFEQLLRTDPDLRQKLADWQSLSEKLGELRAQNPTGRQLDASFADRVIQGAKARLCDQGDPGLAPWIAREAKPATIDVASRLQSRDNDLSDPISEQQHRQRSNRLWIVRGSLMAVAAGLLAMIVLNLPSSKPNALMSPGPTLTQQSSPSDQPSSLEIVIEDKGEPAVKIDPLPNDRNVASTASSGAPSPLSQGTTTDAVPDQSGARSKGSIQPSNALAEARPGQTGSKDAASFSVAPDLNPSAQQIKMLEEMMANPNGTFLMVVDVQLPHNVTDLDALRGILDRHDIAWANELEIDDTVQSTLAKSRMIAEAGKQGLIPDYVAADRGPIKSKDDGETKEVVSLVFVKARGSRLDAALVEVMRQTDEFPVFSFDLAFDPPTHALMNELRFIQEASLPAASNQRGHENVSNVIHRTRGAHFAASPRRTAAMELDTRRQGRLPLDAETMNPISYALFIVRHAPPSSSR